MGDPLITIEIRRVRDELGMSRLSIARMREHADASDSTCVAFRADNLDYLRTWAPILRRLNDVGPPKPIEWPRWARVVRRLRKNGESGVGDTFERLASVGGRVYKRLWAMAKLQCGCDVRKVEWNAKYPYSPVRR